jgi:hypothetical protein
VEFKLPHSLCSFQKNIQILSTTSKTSAARDLVIILQMKFHWTQDHAAWTKPLDRLSRPGSGVQDASQIGWTKRGGVGSGEIRRYRPSTA